MSKIINKSQVTSNYVLPNLSTKQATAESNESATEYMTTSFAKVRSLRLILAKQTMKLNKL